MIKLKAEDIKKTTSCDCNYEPEIMEELEFSEKAWLRICVTNFAYPDSEWTAYLIGKDNKVTDIHIMPQEVGGTIAEIADDGVKPVEGVIGLIHSHNTMFTTMFSTQDAETANHYNYNALTWSNNHLKATKNIKLPCGLTKNLEVKCRIVLASENLTFYNEFTKLITEKKYPITESRTTTQTIKEAGEAENCDYCYMPIISKIKYCDNCGQFFHKHCYKQHLTDCNKTWSQWDKQRDDYEYNQQQRMLTEGRNDYPSQSRKALSGEAGDADYNDI